MSRHYEAGRLDPGGELIRIDSHPHGQFANLAARRKHDSRPQAASTCDTLWRRLPAQCHLLLSEAGGAGRSSSLITPLIISRMMTSVISAERPGI